MNKNLKYVIFLLYKKNLPIDLINYLIINYMEYLTIPNVKRNELEILLNKNVIIRNFKKKFILFKLNSKKIWSPINFILLDSHLQHVRIDYNLNFLKKYNLSDNNILLDNIKDIYRIIPSYSKNYILYRNTILKNINYNFYKFEKTFNNIDIYIIIIDDVIDIIIHKENIIIVYVY